MRCRICACVYPKHFKTCLNGAEPVSYTHLDVYKRQVVDKLNSLDIETLTPIEALNFLYELKQALK